MVLDVVSLNPPQNNDSFIVVDCNNTNIDTLYKLTAIVKNVFSTDFPITCINQAFDDILSVTKDLVLLGVSVSHVSSMHSGECVEPDLDSGLFGLSNEGQRDNSRVRSLFSCLLGLR